MKQIGLAMHNYHDSFTTFPYGGRPTVGLTVEQTGNSGRSSSANYGPTAFVSLLPYLDQAPLYKKFNPNVSITHSNNTFFSPKHSGPELPLGSFCHPRQSLYELWEFLGTLQLWVLCCLGLHHYGSYHALVKT